MAQKNSFDIKCQWNEHFEMVCGRKFRDSHLEMKSYTEV